ncbi:YkvA family protein [Luteimonas sp. SX5]|uniref:YkvA family protein n=1 Tax=Luteimonas galliterrae TaxID=2940486 RepID=A0ABT0MLP9_9GAMM|nr:YkvA family protein [Luteimonas galliterrae]MCL1635820.1 YkvA family protein [Luteimonas galliterrae]
MSISLTIELNDRDLEHFNKAMEAARKAAEGKTPEQVIDAASALLADAQKVHVPDFILDRLLRLDDMIAMVRDTGWELPDEDKQRVMSALVYFADPKDVIPDSVEVLGFLDDAIMIELCVKELKHELDAYDDFCDFRQREAEKRGVEPSKVGHPDWLDSRRQELFERMHQRRERDYGSGYGSSSGYAAKRTYTRTWRPGMFKFG